MKLSFLIEVHAFFSNFCADFLYHPIKFYDFLLISEPLLSSVTHWNYLQGLKHADSVIKPSNSDFFGQMQPG